MIHNETDQRRKEFFNEHAGKWLDMFYLSDETGAYDRYDEEFARLFDIIDLHEGDTVLDAGCGCGVLVPYIHDCIGPDSRLYEMDYAENMIAENKRLHNDERIVFLVGSVENIDIPTETLDSVICFSCFPHFQRKAESLKELGRTLKTGGTLTIGHFDSAEEINNRHSKHISVMHDRLPSEEEMRELLDNAGFNAELFVDEPGFYCIRAIFG